MCIHIHINISTYIRVYTYLSIYSFRMDVHIELNVQPFALRYQQSSQCASPRDSTSPLRWNRGATSTL